MNDKQKILDLLDSGQLSADQAVKLIKALGSSIYDPEEHKRILGLLSEKQISVDQAAELFEALRAPQPPLPPMPAVVSTARTARVSRPDSPRAPRAVAKLIRISIDAQDSAGSSKAKVNVNVPIALAKFASKFVPQQAKEQLEMQGINLADILDSLGGDMPEGRLIDIDASDSEDGTTAKIVIEVV